MYYDDSVIERSTEQKLLLHLLPMLCLLAMACMLNHLSLGYAAPAMAPALGLSDTQLAIAENLFCAGYLLASLPAIWLLLRFGAKRWITSMVLATGVIALAHAAVWDAGSLYVAHFLLGATEASLPPAMVFYLTQWMPERHRGKAIATLIAAAAVVPVLAAEGSSVLLLLARWFGINDWRFLFVVEAVPTLWLGLHTPARTPLAPAEVSWLPPSERLWLLDQLRQNVAPGSPVQFAGGLRSAPIRKLAAIECVIGLVAGSLGMWVPLAMQETGYVPPGVGTIIMIVASVAGVAAAVAAGLVLGRRSQWGLALAGALVLTGACLAIAAVLPSGIGAVLMLAVVAAVAPGILALTWVLGPCVVAGAAAAAGFAILSMAGALGYYAAAGLAAVRSDASARCLILAVACLVAAWLTRGLDGRHPAKLTASAASPGE
jgi:ACS family tartrate transporter-like MFS transporter